MIETLDSPEFLFLRAVCGGDGARLGSIPALAAGVGDWDRVLRLAGGHGLAAYLAAWSLKADTTGIPEHVLSGLQAVRKRTVLDFELRAGLLRELLDRLGMDGSQLMEVKGGQVAAWAFDDPRQRHVGDLDLLVRGEDFRDIDQAIQAMGYVRTAPKIDLDDRTMPLVRHSRRTLEYVRKGPYPGIDLHWRWTSNPHILEFDAGRVWDGTEAERNTEMFLFLVVHGGRHAWCRLAWLLDIHRLATADLASPVDWPAVHQRARGLGVESWLSLAFSMSRAVFDTPCPIANLPPARDALVRQCRDAILGQDRSALLPVSWPALYRELLGCDHWSQRARLLRFAVFTPSDRDIAAVALPRGWEAGYGLLRPFLWIGRRLGL
jgi:hypothetical protein